MRPSFKALSLSLSEAARFYVEYLKYTHIELPDLNDLFPRSAENGFDFVSFHRELCCTMKANDDAFVGIKVLPSSSEAVNALSGVQPLCVPLFRSMLGSRSFSLMQQRLQYVCPAIAIRLSSSPEVESTCDSIVHHCGSFCAALEVTGTRYPFYPPTLSALACDLASCVGVVVGNENLLTKSAQKKLLDYSLVLKHEDDPVQVGCGKLCMGSPFEAAQHGAVYARLIGQPLQSNHIIVCSGISPHYPVAKGNYTLQWGSYGSTRCTVN